tara:strand:- start:237 stop:428 length:192 start_codon:yes stop_codon:yes gene_type:complete
MAFQEALWRIRGLTLQTLETSMTQDQPFVHQLDPKSFRQAFWGTPGILAQLLNSIRAGMAKVT